MKNNLVSKKLILLAVTMALIAFAGSASATTVLTGAAFNQTPSTTGVLGETFVSAATTNPEPDPFSLADGVTLTLSLNDTGGGFSEATQPSGNIAPFEGGVFDNGGTDTVTLSGLTPGDSYEVVAYSNSVGQGNPTLYGYQTFTFNGVSEPVTGGQGTSFVEGVNYLENLEVADSSGDVSFTVNNAGGSYPTIDGVGIASAPEPTTYALLGLGGLGLLWARRRRASQV